MALYPASLVQARIDAWFAKNNTKHHVARRAWTKLKGYALVVAATDYGLRPKSKATDKDKALSYAWEDFTVAMRGYGDNVSTGFLLQMFSSLDAPACRSLGLAMSEAINAADVKAERDGVVRRYGKEYLDAPVVCKGDGFILPYAVPHSGAPVADWVRDHEEEDVAEVIIEHLRERHGAEEQVAEVRAPRKPTHMASRGHLTLVHNSAVEA